ncbi:SEC-C domain-containing protein [candidate division WOR-3 bacterium]|nr:SEC-C domain-containing protein [candidate division WOR-3 bacterium]MCK4333370.1 SEC-C domain-containing protein [candidate division WOR-3 bacterium]
MVRSLQRETTKLLFRAQLRQVPVRRQAPVHAYQESASSAVAGASSNPEAGQSQGRQKPVKVKKKVGRNDPCPCGSGKKYKKCCYPQYG